MAQIDESHTEVSRNNISTFDADLSKATNDSNSQAWDSTSMYHVKNFINYSSIEEADTFDYLHLDLSKSNREKSFPKIE